MMNPNGFIWLCEGGKQALRTLAMRIFERSTIILSNVAGPSEEISLFDHQISYVAASISGFPQVSPYVFFDLVCKSKSISVAVDIH